MKIQEVDIFDQEWTLKRVFWNISDIVLTAISVMIDLPIIAIVVFVYKKWCVNTLFDKGSKD